MFHRAYDDGAAEVAQVVGAMKDLNKVAGPRRFGRVFVDGEDDWRLGRGLLELVGRCERFLQLGPHLDAGADLLLKTLCGTRPGGGLRADLPASARTVDFLACQAPLKVTMSATFAVTMSGA